MADVESRAFRGRAGSRPSAAVGALAAIWLFSATIAFAQDQTSAGDAAAPASGQPQSPVSAAPPLADLEGTVDSLVADEAQQQPPPVSPDVFGTSAVLATRTTMDERWRRVHAPPADDSTLRVLIALAPQSDRLQQATYVETQVSRRIAFRSDWDNWGADDYWATPEEVFARGAGDCEDSAIVKLAALRMLGFEDRDLYLMIGKNRGGLEHAVLLARIDGNFWVLDDGATRIEPAEAFDTFLPLMTFAAGATWIHGKATEVQRPVDWIPDRGEPDPSLTIPPAELQGQPPSPAPNPGTASRPPGP